MNRRLSKSKSLLVSASILLILAIVFCSIIGNFTKQGDKTVTATAVAPGTASILNLNSSGEDTNNFKNAVQGGQKEYIYFGNISTGAIKWRVLTNDSKYSSGDMLLWADSSLGIESFNSSTSLYPNANFAFWGTCMARAKLNGGDYIKSTADGYLTINEDDSWYSKIFKDTEKLSVVPANNYETYLFGRVVANRPILVNTNIVGSGSDQYATSFISGLGGKYANADSSGSLIETTIDKLFFLDYYDVNNVEYGFGDNGTVYANMVDSSWNVNTNGYPSFSDDGGTAKANYLKGENFWLRNAGLFTSNANVLRVDRSGYIICNAVNNSYGIRPAFNFSPSSVVYATASSVSNNDFTFSSVSAISSVDGKPAYKVYTKANNYVNYNTNSSTTPVINITNSNVSVTKTGQSGKAIILLADKSGNGEVKYQATADFVNGVATASVPGGVNAKNYSITVLFADELRGDNYSESITGSYTNMILDEPGNISMVYTGNKLTMADVADNQKGWYDEQYIEITYPNSLDGLTDVDTYEVKAEIRNEFQSIMKFNGTPDASKGETQYIRYFDFEITPKIVEYPKFYNDINKKEYDGGNELLFTLVYDANAIDIKYKGISITNKQVKESAVGKYALEVSLKDTKNYAWKSGSPTKLEFEVAK